MNTFFRQTGIFLSLKVIKLYRLICFYSFVTSKNMLDWKLRAILFGQTNRDVFEDIRFSVENETKM